MKILLISLSILLSFNSNAAMEKNCLAFAEGVRYELTFFENVDQRQALEIKWSGTLGTGQEVHILDAKYHPAEPENGREFGVYSFRTENFGSVNFLTDENFEFHRVNPWLRWISPMNLATEDILVLECN